MKMTQHFGKTLREDPTEAETISHTLLLKTGMIKQLSSGVYTYMPLAFRSLKKIENIIREELDFIGCQELRMPALQPLEIWQASGRAEAFGTALFTVTDRRERDLVIAPTHEEAITMVVKSGVHSYRDLPKILYQIQTKFRDEARPRGGLLRVREFDMKDAYSFDIDEAGLALSYQSMSSAYRNIYRRCGIDPIMVEADSGAIGGKDSHEFLLTTESGEDIMLICPGCGYSANEERAESVRPVTTRDEVAQQLDEIYTPGIKTIDELTRFLGITKDQTLKVVIYSADGDLILVAIRGDLEVNEIKLKNLLGSNDLRIATDQELERDGLVPGFVSPIGLDGIKIVADSSIGIAGNFVTGSNRLDYHLINGNYPRDFKPDLMVDVGLAREGHGCIHCGAILEAKKGIEIGHVFKLGTFFSEVMGANFLDSQGAQRPIVMGCYGIGVGRLLGAIIEEHHDDKGIVFPVSVSPYQVHMITLNAERSEITDEGDRLYQELSDKGFEVMYDDRQETAGVKLNDADLLGFPVRILISPRTLGNGVAEITARASQKTTFADLDGVSRVLAELLASYDG